MSLEKQRVAFYDFILDANEKILLKAGTPIPITPKVFHLLLVLIENHGHLVEKQTLMDSVWPKSFVEESNLTFTMRQLRKVLGDDIQHPIFVETIPRRGYRFIAPTKPVLAPGKVEDESTRQPLNKAGGIWRSRPIFFLLMLASITAAAFSAGVILWEGKDRRLKNAGLENDRSPGFETIASSDGPMTVALSPDGGYFAYSRTTNGRQSLWLRQFSSGVNTQIIAPEDGVTYSALVFSPDGAYIYFSRRFRNEPSRIDRVSILGGAPKVNILSDVDGTFSISADNRRISFRRYEPKKRSLLVADIDGTNQRQLFETDKTFTANVFSPDSQTIAFATGQSDTGDRDFGVYTLDPNTGIVKPASDFRWTHVRDISWLPDQSGLLVTAYIQPGAPSQLWQISMADGQVTRVLNSQYGFATISAASDMSTILLTQVSRTANLCLAPSLKPDNIVPVAEAADGFAWMPDGGLVYSSPSVGNRDIWRLDPDKTSTQQLTTEDSIDFDPTVSPDGRYVVFVSDRAGKFNLWRINSDGTDPVALTNGEGEQQPVFTADGSFVVFSSMKDVSLWKISIFGGEPIKVSDKRAYDVSISPDGTEFAHFANTDGQLKILIRSLETADVLKELDPIKGLFAGSQVVWSKESRDLFYAAHDNNSVGNIWRQPISGGLPEKLTHYMSGEIFYFDFSPDDSQVAMIRGGWKYDAILLKGFK